MRSWVSQVRVLVEFPLAERVRLPGELLLLAVRGGRLAHQPHGAALLQQTQRGRVRTGSTRVPDGGGRGGGRRGGRAGGVVQLIHCLRHRGQGGRGGVGVKVRGGAKKRGLVQPVGMWRTCRGISGLPSQGSAPRPVVSRHQGLLDLQREDARGHRVRLYRLHYVCCPKSAEGRTRVLVFGTTRQFPAWAEFIFAGKLCVNVNFLLVCTIYRVRLIKGTAVILSLKRY